MSSGSSFSMAQILFLWSIVELVVMIMDFVKLIHGLILVLLYCA